MGRVKKFRKVLSTNEKLAAQARKLSRLQVEVLALAWTPNLEATLDKSSFSEIQETLSFVPIEKRRQEVQDLLAVDYRAQTQPVYEPRSLLADLHEKEQSEIHDMLSFISIWRPEAIQRLREGISLAPPPPQL